MSERFYTNSALRLGPIELDGPEAHHLAAVCRLRAGDAVYLFNGDGADYLATVVEVAKKRVSLEVTEGRPVNRELAFRLEAAVSLPKGDRGQFLLEKLTELGVTAFTPLICERSVVHPKDATLEKLRRYVIEASKQCGRNVLMEIQQAATWDQYAVPRGAEVRLFAHPGLSTANALTHGPSIRFAVGPEGGFTPKEVELAQEHVWQGVDLGARILRVETAAIALAVQMSTTSC
jgi:16S rRNA (uracil1498-N3)-methyltransferase